jgi:sugar O-acyltransferase (sialic acid O-acetyltransferase NeuD family)
MTDALLYGAGSPFVVDLEESCRRCGYAIRACVANSPGPSYAAASAHLVMPPRIASWPMEERTRLATFVAPLTPGYRKAIADELDSLGLTHRPPLVDPTALVAGSAAIGDGVYVNAGAILAGSASVEALATVNRGANVGHHARVGRFAAIGPGAILAGSVVVEEGAFVGAGAIVAPGCTIGRNAIVGAGAVVLRDVAPNTVVVGNPARKIREGIAGYNDVGV